MELVDRKAITDNWQSLCQLIKPADLLPVLLHKDVFTSSIVERIEKIDRPIPDIAARILSDVTRRGPDAFKKLLDALLETGHEEAARILKPDIDTSEFLASSPSKSCLKVRVAKRMKTSPNDCYKMTSKPLGYCLIVNNVEFENNLLETRLGSDRDVERLSQVFTDLSYEVVVRRNLTAEDMHQFFQEYSRKEDLDKHDSLAVVILSHGETEAIYGTDNFLVNFRDILQYFNNRECKYLRHKPKMFFIQACRGKTKDFGYSSQMKSDAATFEEAAMSRRAEGGVEPPVPEFNFKQSASYSDMIVSYSTVYGYVSVRHPINGSWYCWALACHLSEHAKSLDLFRILRKVDQEVQDRTSDFGWKQTTAIEIIGFNKDLYFNPGLALESE